MAYANFYVIFCTTHRRLLVGGQLGVKAVFRKIRHSQTGICGPEGAVSTPSGHFTPSWPPTNRFRMLKNVYLDI